MGAWQLVRLSGAGETIFKFHRSVKIDGGASITIWSSDSGVNHDPPANIVMKQQKWFTGDNIKTQLLNAEGEVYQNCFSFVAFHLNDFIS